MIFSAFFFSAFDGMSNIINTQGKLCSTDLKTYYTDLKISMLKNITNGEFLLEYSPEYKINEDVKLTRLPVSDTIESVD